MPELRVTEMVYRNKQEKLSHQSGKSLLAEEGPVWMVKMASPQRYFSSKLS